MKTKLKSNKNNKEDNKITKENNKIHDENKKDNNDNDKDNNNNKKDGYVIKYDEWNSWSYKSNNTNFKSSSKFYGDGEEKLGREFDTVPLGQNYSYDLDIQNEKWECKKLDSDSSFRLGVDVFSKYIDVLLVLINIFTKLDKVFPKLLDNDIKKKTEIILQKIKETSKSCKTSLYDGLKKHEVSASNLIKANSIIKELKQIINSNHDIKIQTELYCSYTGKMQNYDIETAFHKLSIDNIEVDKIVKKIKSDKNYNVILLKSSLCNDLNFFNVDLQELLNKIVRETFNNKRLILVDSKKGYKPINNLQWIVCNRITSGSPRCKFINT